MNLTGFETFKSKYLKEEVIEYPNQRKGKEPLVTVRVLVYNHVDFLDDCLHSILNQKVDFDYEILVAEDESNDGSREKCIQYAQAYPEKIRLLLNSRKNNIPIRGRPSGLFNSVYSNFTINSKYIALCEADDYWTDPESLQKRVDFLETHSDYVLCFHNAFILYDEKKKISKSRLVPYNGLKSFSKKQLLNAYIPTASLMFRHRLVNLFDEEMKHILNGDWILQAKLSLYGKGMYLHHINPSIRRIHKNGCFSSLHKVEQIICGIEARNYLKSKYNNIPWIQKRLPIIISEFYIIAFYRELKNYNFSLNFIFSSIKHSKNFLHWLGVAIPFLLRKFRDKAIY